MTKFASTSNGVGVCLFSQNETKCTVRVSTGFTSLLLAVRTSTFATARKKIKVTMIVCHYYFKDEKFFILCCLEQTNLKRFLALENFTTCLPPYKPRDTLKSVCKDGWHRD